MARLFLVLRMVLGLAFAAAAVAKIAGAPMMVEEFGRIGMGQGFRFATAACELIGAALLVPVRTTAIGAAILVCVCVGALIAQLYVLDGDPIHCIVLGGLAAAVVLHYRVAPSRAPA